MLHLQKFLIETNGDRQRLSSEYGIVSTQHPDYPDLYQFCYDQIESSKVKDHPIVRESRGIILSSSEDWSVVARPFDRFFNWGENVDENIFNWSAFVAQEKIDGSMMILYYFNRKWNVATKGSPSAGGSVGDNPFTFSELFWKTFHRECINLDDLDSRNTYLFELTSKYNRIITSQINNEGKLTLIGVRDTKTGLNFPVQLYSEFFQVVRSFSMSTIEEIVSAANKLNPTEQEGFVLVDNNFNRIKVKSEKYVLIHHVKDTLSPSKILDLIKMREDSEILVYFPDLKASFDDAQKKYDLYITFLDSCWKEIPNFSSRKEFALYVMSHFDPFWRGFFFSKIDGKVKNAEEWLATVSSDKIVKFMGDEYND